MKVPNNYRVTQAHVRKNPQLASYASDESYGNSGAFLIPRKGKINSYFFIAIASDGAGWEHVSVSIPSEKRTPTWEEMCYIKDLFWDEDEAVVQYHPPKSKYVNNHPYCLHLWRPVGYPLPVPDSILVGTV